MHKIKLILLLILPLSVLGQDLGIIDTKTTKNPAINGTHRISTDGKNLFFRNFFGLSKKVASTDSAVFTGTTVLPSNTTIGNVSATELGYLDGVTSPIQAQINSIGGNKVFYGTVDVTNAVSLTANIGDLYINTTSKAVYKKTNLSFPTGLTYIALASGTWVKLGNFSLTKNDVGLSDVDNTSDANKPISSATQTALNGKENTLTKGNITSTDLTITGGTNSIIGTGVTISLSSLGRIRHFSGAGDVTNAISLTANIGDIYFNTTNGTVYQKSNLSFPSGLTYITLASGTWVKLGDYTLDKSKVGLSNVDNTSDANKPISSATQTALDLKANITSPTFITDATTPRLKITGAGDVGKGSDLVMAGNSNDLTMHGTGKVILGTGGFQRLVVTNAGNVGVGTTAPVAKFEVSGLAGFRYNDGKQADGKYLRSNSTGVAAWDSVKVSEVFGLNTTYLPISNPTSTGTLTAPTIANSLGANFATTSGNVGVGTASPAYKLDVNGTFKTTSTTDLVVQGGSASIGASAGTNTVGLEIGTNRTGTGTSFIDLGGDATSLDYGIRIKRSGLVSSMEHSGTGEFLINSLNTGNILFATQNTERMRMFANGNVGIGTTTPLKKLEVADVIRSSSNFAGFEAIHNTGTSYRWTLNNDNNYLLQSSSDKFVANATTRLSLFDGGNIGIGTSTNAGYKLNVIGGVSNFADNILLSGGGTNNKIGFNADAVNYYIQGINSGIQYSPYSVGNFTFTSGAGNWSFTNGNVGIGTASPTSKIHVIRTGVGIQDLLTLDNLNQSVGVLDGVRLNLRGFNIEASSTYGSNDNILNLGFSTSKQITLLQNGNVGIGTNSPAVKLEVIRTGVGIQDLLTLDNLNKSVGVLDGVRLNLRGFNIEASSTYGTSDNILNLGFSTSKQITLLQNGNVGIGTNSPAVKLEVNDTANTNAVIVKANGATTFLGIGNSSSLPTLQAYTAAFAGTTNLLINPSGGNVGIGTTSPAAKLNIEGTGYTTALIRSSTTTAGGLLTLSNTTRSYSLGARGDYSAGQFNIVDETAGLARFSISSNGRVGIGTTTDAGYLTDINGTLRTVNDAYFATTSGKVGIGTTTPQNLLHVKGTASVGVGVRNSHLIIESTETAGVGVGAVLKFAGQSGNTVNPYSFGTIEARKESAVANNYSSYMTFQTIESNGGSTERMRISGNGNIGIGTDAPLASSILDIASTTKGVLFPRMTTGEINNITSPADGLTVYNTTLKAICFYDSSAAVWKRVSHSNM